MEGEILDVYDENRIRTGRTHVRGKKVREGDFIMVVHVWILNGSGEFLIQKRQPWKELFPGMWDCAVAGAAHAGDSSEQAAAREAKEELDLDLDMSSAELIMTDKFSFGFDDIWLVRQELEIDGLTIQAEEVETVRWAGPEEIREMAERGEFIKYYYLEKMLGIAENA
jgi:isopentenyldiphosphate isomerase